MKALQKQKLLVKIDIGGAVFQLIMLGANLYLIFRTTSNFGMIISIIAACFSCVFFISMSLVAYKEYKKLMWMKALLVKLDTEIDKLVDYPVIMRSRTNPNEIVIYH